MTQSKMNSITSICCILLTVVLSHSTKPGRPACDGPGGTEPVFDYYLLSMQHPKGVCQTNICEICESRPYYKEWTIHGLWPSIRGELGPNYCGDPYQNFNLISLWPIRMSLLTTWPSVCREFGGSVSFWEYEYCKHGTCARNIPAIDTELEYFTKTLELTETYDFQAILEANGVTPNPSSKYTYSDFNNAFQDAIKVRPFLECQFNEKEEKHILYQISICLDKSFNAVDCDPSTYVRDTACTWIEDIYYL